MSTLQLKLKCCQVKLATHLLTGVKVAIKIMDKRQLGEDLPRIRWIFEDHTHKIWHHLFHQTGNCCYESALSSEHLQTPPGQSSRLFFARLSPVFDFSHFSPFFIRFWRRTQKSTWCWSIVQGESYSTTLWTGTDYVKQRVGNSSDRCFNNFQPYFSPPLTLPVYYRLLRLWHTFMKRVMLTETSNPRTSLLMTTTRWPTYLSATGWAFTLSVEADWLWPVCKTQGRGERDSAGDLLWQVEN